MRAVVSTLLVALLVTACNARPPAQGGGGGTPTTAAHPAHFSAYGVDPWTLCSQCHDGAFDVTLQGRLATANGAQGTFNSSTLTCSGVYCHDGGPQLKIGGGTTPSPVWNPPVALACNGCHAPPGGALATPWHPAVAVGVQCGLCHPGYTNSRVPTPTPPDLPIHVNGVVNLNSPSIASTDPARRCTSCHGTPGRAVPPGGDPLTAAAPPVDRTGSSSTSQVGVGAHQSHLAPGASAIANPIGCSECHVVPTDLVHVGPTDLTPATLTWGTRASDDGATPAFDPVAATCTNYCHGQTLGAGGSNTTPVWTVVNGTQATCGSCHGLPGGAVATPWHPAVATGADCGLCHPGYTRTTANVSIHVNGVVDVRAPHLETNCTACHGDVTRLVPPGGSPLIADAPPVDRFGSSATSQAGVGAHQAHLAPGASGLAPPIACTECHVIPAGLVHVGPTWVTPATVDWGSLASANGASPQLVQPGPGSTSVTCSNVYCHAGGPGLRLDGGTLTTPTWNPPSQVTCGSCHALPGGSVATPWHPAVATGADCGLCHPGYTRSTVNVSIHVNGVVEVRAPNLAIDCTACHGTPGRLVPPGGDPLVAAAPPVDRTGSSSTSHVGVGAHQSHLAPGTSAIASPIACSECHVVPSVPTSLVHVGPTPLTPASLVWGALASANGATPGFVASAVTCANYCHGQTLPPDGTLTQPKWTTLDGTQAACGTCHGNPPTSGEHLLHVVYYPKVSCGVCHPAGYAPGVVGPGAVPVHVNGHVDLNATGFSDWNPTAAGPGGWTGTAIGCHGGVRYWFPGSAATCQ